jgi:outer membrane receptor protein involved in Fe transport
MESAFGSCRLTAVIGFQIDVATAEESALSRRHKMSASLERGAITWGNTMRSGKRQLFGASGIVTCLALLGAHPATAADTAPSTQVEEVVVTARLRSENLAETPAVVTAVSGESLEQQGITTISQLTQVVPLVTIVRGSLADVFYIRGIGTQANNAGFEQSVGLFMDGVYFGNGRWVGQGGIDVDSAQILKGPQGVYFGKNTVAGAVSLTSRNPSQEFEGYARVGYEFNADARFIEGVVSGPLSDQLSARMVLRFDEMDGWFQNTNGRESPSSAEQFGRLTLLWEPTDTFTANLKISADHYEDDGPTALSQLFVCAGPGGGPSTLGNGFGLTATENCRLDFTGSSNLTTTVGPTFTNYDSYAVTLNATWDVGPGTLTSVTGYNRFDLRWLGDFDFSNAAAIFATESFRNLVFSEELRYQTNFDGPLNVLVGAYYQTSDYFHENDSTVFPAFLQGTACSPACNTPGFTWYRPSTQDSTTVAALVEFQWEITPTLQLDVGGRYTSEEKKSRMQNVSAASGGPAFIPPGLTINQLFLSPVFASTYNDDDFSPQAILRWKPNDDVMLYGAYKTGYKAGGFSHGAVITAFTAPASLEFGPEQVKGFEVGAKFFLLDRTLQVNIAAYDYEFDDLQVNAFNPATTSFTVQNAAKAETKGVELEGIFRITSELRLAGTIAYNQGQFIEFTGQCYVTQTAALGCNVPVGAGFGQDLAGKPTPYSPEWAGRLDLNYSHEFDGGLRIIAGFGAQYSGRYQLDQLNRPDLAQPSFWRYDANVALTPADEKWRLALIGRNLSNEAILLGGTERPLGGADLMGSVDRKRQIELQLTYRF